MKREFEYDKKNILLAISFSLVLWGIIFLLCSCSCTNTSRKETEIEVTDSETGVVISRNRTVEFNYDGKPKLFGVKVKLLDSDKYLGNDDFDNKDWKSHILLLIKYENDVAYTDKNVKDWETDWPSEIGKYEIQLEFNNHDPTSRIKNDAKYYSAKFFFTIKII